MTSTRSSLNGFPSIPRALAAFVMMVALSVSVAGAQLRVVNYNVAGLNGNQPALQAVFAALNADDKPGFAVAPHLYVFQEMHSTDTAPLLTLLNAAAPPGVTYALGTYTNISENGTAGAQAMYFRSDTLSEITAGHVDIFTGGGRYSDRWQLKLNAYDSPQAEFYIYSSHLKASTGSSNAAERLSGATAIRNNADALPAGTHIIYAGDWNVYNNAEAAYQKFLSIGNGQAFDPLGTGTWAGAANAIKHTQSPCATSCSLVNGGMDDRFDFQVSTSAFQDAEGLALIPGSYRSFGNDGNHYDNNINTGNNSYYPSDIPRSNALANNLKIASDHIPVVADYQLPAALSAEIVECPCIAIVGASIQVQLTVANSPWMSTSYANEKSHLRPRVALASHATHSSQISPFRIHNEMNQVAPRGALPSVAYDELDFLAEGWGAFSGEVSGTAFWDQSPVIVAFDIDTTTAGSTIGTVEVSSTSQAAAGNPTTLNVPVHILRAANASFDDQTDINSVTVAESIPADSGIQVLSVPVHNFGYDALQVTLDIDQVTGMVAPFSGGDASKIAGIGVSPSFLVFSFDSTGLTPGIYENEIEISVSDENLPGESSTSLALTLSVTIEDAVEPILGDIDCDVDLDMDDVSTLCSVLVESDTTACHMSQADLNESGTPDADDIQLFIDTFLTP